MPKHILMEHIIVQIGTFADGKGTPCFQIHSLEKEKGYYKVASNIGPNDPVPLTEAIKRLADVANWPPSEESL